MNQRTLFSDQEEADGKAKLGRKGGTPLTELVSRKMLENLYLHQEKTLENIAKILGCSKTMVQILMKSHDLQRRKRSAARVLAIKNNKFDRFEYHDIDEDFFGQWTPEMAWVLGLLFTDGHVRRHGISISSIDLDLLENVSRFLKTSRPIKKCTQSYDKTKHIYQLEFFREKMRDDLRYLGLVEKKSLVMQFPNVPDEYMRHFIRGCWDGDGSIYIDRENKLNASYVTGSHEFIKRLVVELAKVGITKQRQGYLLSIYKEKRSNAYTIKLNSRNNLETLFHCFYAGVDNAMFLKRKYDTFVRGLNVPEDTQKAMRAVPYHYTAIPVRHETPTGSIFKQGTADDMLRRGNLKGQNKKVLKIKNKDGRLKCKRCGDVSEILHMINEAYCPECFQNATKHKIKKRVNFCTSMADELLSRLCKKGSDPEI